MSEYQPDIPPDAPLYEPQPIDGGPPPDEIPLTADPQEPDDSPIDSQDENGSEPVTTPLGQSSAPIDESVETGDEATQQDNSPELPQFSEMPPRPAPPCPEDFEPSNSWRIDTFGPMSSDQAGLPVRRGGGTDENPEDQLNRLIDQRIEMARARSEPEQYRINPYKDVFPFQSLASGKWFELINSGTQLVAMTSGRTNLSATGLGVSIPLAASGAIASGTRGVMLSVEDTTAKRFIALANQPRGLFELDVTQVAGTQGILTSASQTFAAFKYKCFLQGTTAPVLAQSATPEWHLAHPGPMVSATKGMGYYNHAGFFKLATTDASLSTSVFKTCNS